MKTKLSVAAMALLLASCSSNDNDLLPENPVNATPIQVSQSVQGMVKTRAAVGVGSDVTATVLVADGSSNNADAADWANFSPVLANEVTEDGGQNKLKTRATVPPPLSRRVLRPRCHSTRFFITIRLPARSLGWRLWLLRERLAVRR